MALILMMMTMTNGDGDNNDGGSDDLAIVESHCFLRIILVVC